MKRRHLSTRDRAAIFEAAHGRCSFCGEKIDGTRERWEVSHEIPLALGGADDRQNCRPAHYRCHREQTAAIDLPAIAKAKRIEARHVGARRSARPMPGSRASGERKRMNGTVERWP